MSELSIHASFDQPVIHATFEGPALNAQFPNAPVNIENSISAQLPLSFDPQMGELSIPPATADDDGYLTKEDWTEFNSKAAGNHTHPAADITFTPSGDLESENVQDAIDELNADKASNEDLTAHTNNTNNPHGVTAVQVPFSDNALTDPLSATEVDGALKELRTRTNTINTTLPNKADLVGGVIPTAQIPAIAITEFLGAVADESAMLALTGQRGDWCIRQDTSMAYILITEDPTQAANWIAIPHPQSPVLSVNGQTGVVVLNKADVGLGNVDNTSDANKPVSTAQASADAAVQAYAIQRGNHTGTQLASTISDFAATVRAVVLTGLDLTSAAAITAADTVLSALGKLQKQITDLGSSKQNVPNISLSTPAAPTATTSATLVHMGLALSFTPTGTRMKISITGRLRSSGAGASITSQMAYGTGTAPVNGAAQTGTLLGASISAVEPTGVNTAYFPVTMIYVATGLTPGTTYWVDVCLSTSGGTAIIANLSTVIEDI